MSQYSRSRENIIDQHSNPHTPTYSIETINESIHEYLLKCGYYETVDVLQEEIANKQSNISYFLNTSRESQYENFGQAYILDVEYCILYIYIFIYKTSRHLTKETESNFSYVGIDFSQCT